jgi:hypothetical protein
VLALRDSAYAEWHLWLSRRFFAAGDLESGRSNLNLAFRHDPDLAADSERLLLAFEQEAVDWRSPGPLACVENLYASLPPEATGLAGQKERLTARVRLDLALRALAGGDTTGARALCLDSSLPVQLFVRAVTHAALTLPVDPLEFTDRCLALLPAGTRALHRQVSASVLAACGFDDFHSGLRRRAARRFLHAVWLSPGWLRNRGVRAALVKSLADFLVLRAEVAP